MNEILVTLDDFRIYANVPPSLDFDQLVASIIEAQRNFILPAMGGAMYRDMHTNQDSTEYVTLIQGGSYIQSGKTLDFWGLKPAIVFYSYATFLHDNDMRVTRTGNKVKQSEVSEQATTEMINAEYAKALNKGKRYLDKATDFIRANSTDYPLFEQGRTVGSMTSASAGHSEFGRGSGWRYGANGEILNGGNYGN